MLLLYILRVVFLYGRRFTTGMACLKVLESYALLWYSVLALLSCTIGLLGLGLIIGEVIPDNRISLQDGIIVKEYYNGNAISDSRATTIEVFRTIPWLPVVEWRKVKKRYEWLELKDNVQADFDASKQILTLKGIETTPGTKQYKHWQDIIIF